MKNNTLAIVAVFSVLISLSSIAFAENLCQYASGASATSENALGSLANYALGIPNAPVAGCDSWDSWSGYGFSWTAANWDVKANITLTYETPVLARNITVFGDYDMCWNQMFLKNSETGNELNLFTGIDNTCIDFKDIPGNFLADTVILQNCGWSWSSTDAVQLCGETQNAEPPEEPPVLADAEVCTWKNCKKGAVSVSVDDGFASCMSELEAKGYRGTYFLSGTNQYSTALWTKFKNAYKKGHEIASHTRSHYCIEVPDATYYKEVESNILDITSKMGIKRTSIISHAHPCGFTTQNYTTTLTNVSNNWNFLSARGYYDNILEEATPQEAFDLKTYNSHGYPGGEWEPPSYFSVVDQAESEGKWANLAFHVECDEDGVFSYLPTKSVWVDTIGNVMRYIRLRDASDITQYVSKQKEINFHVNYNYSSSIYAQNLTIRSAFTGTVSGVQVNNASVPFTTYNYGEGKAVQFDVPYRGRNIVNISRQ